MAHKKEVEEVEEPKNTLEALLTMKNVEYGALTISKGSSWEDDPSRIPTGIFSVDFASGGGVPLWQSTCFWGGDSAGKTTAALSALSMSQKICWRYFNLLEYCTCSLPPLKMKGFWADTENTFNKGWASSIGVDQNEYYLALADHGEQFINLSEAALRADDCGLLVIDSLAGFVPATEFDAPSEDQFIGNQAKMITRAVRRLKQRAIRERKRGHPCAIIFTNQMRKKIGVMYGDPEVMPGGHGMMHEFSLLFRCVRKSMGSEPDKKYVDSTRRVNMAQRHSFAIRKEKVLTLAGVAEFIRVREDIDSMELKKGMVDDYNTVMNYAKEYEVVYKDKGKWKVFDASSKTLAGIQSFWKKRPLEYYRAQREIIKRAKERLSGHRAST